jgi:hypothetical protein
MSLVRRLFDAFQTGDSGALKSLLDEVDIENFDTAKNKKFFVSLMNQTFKSPLGVDAAKIIMKRWHQSDADALTLPTPAYFMMQTDIDIKILQRMLEALDEWDYVNFVYEYLLWDSSPEVELALKHLDTLYGTQSQAVYQALLDQIDVQFKEQGTYNHIVKTYLVDKIQVVSDYAPRPEWIVNLYGDFLPDEEDPTLQPKSVLKILDVLPSSEKAANLILETFQYNPKVQALIQQFQNEEPEDIEDENEALLKPLVFHDLPILFLEPSVLETPASEEACPLLTSDQLKTLQKHEGEIREALTITYNNATVQGKLDMLGGLAPKIDQDRIQNDETLFRLLGPSNPILGQVLSQDDLETKPYGCRMLTCTDFDNEDEFGDLDEDDQNVEWFAGTCEVCHLKIAKKIYALRRPLTFGGWKGTFCSFECLRKAVPLNDVHNHFIIDLVENQLKDVGIQNRIVAEEGDQINDEELERRLKEGIDTTIRGDKDQAHIEALGINPRHKYNI